MITNHQICLCCCTAIFDDKSGGVIFKRVQVANEGVCEKVMEKKLYVGNLSYDTNEQDLRTMFSQAGSVETVDLIKDRDTGRSKGFAFIEMATQEEAEKAITMFNGQNVDNRVLKVNIAKPREDKPRSSYSGGYSSGYSSNRSNKPGSKKGYSKRY